MVVEVPMSEETAALLKIEAQEASVTVGELVAEMVLAELARHWGETLAAQ